MWTQFLETLLFSTFAVPYRPGIAELALIGIICCCLGCLIGACSAALLLSHRLRRLVAAFVVEGLQGWDRPLVLQEDRLAGYRRQ